jgi:ribosomal protein L11 methyltransferase
MTGGGRKRWFAVKVTARPDAVEAVEHAFNILDSLGTEISDLRQVEAGEVRIAGYFDEPPGNAVLAAAVNDALRIYGLRPDRIIAIDTLIVPETDWLAEWKRHWRPSVVGPFIVAPPWAAVEPGHKIVIRIEPNMAFGTGTHETTQLCLEAIGENLRDGMSFLDVGTGTGILAIAAAKLSLSSTITACDVDPESVNIALENAAANGVADRIDFFEGSIDQRTRPADFVCANLTLDAIGPLLPKLLESATQLLLLSGILAEQEALLRAQLLRFQISDLKFEYSGEWLSVLIRTSGD